ncbi:MAG: hypothetical protein KF784_01120 [Fimbriimonadaceae bacterium]|nr:hypothetical protein [Fimbriimonadaceae bacterium]
MNRIDWQAFDDGSLTPEEIVQIKQALRNDPAIKAEWEGFQALKSEIKRTRENEPVPTDRLNAMLDTVLAGRQRKGVTSRRWVVAGAAASVLAAAYIGYGLLGVGADTHGGIELPPEADTLAMNDTASAKSWIDRHASFRMPELTLPREAKVVKAAYGKTECWACMDFEYNGKTFCLLVTVRQGVLDDKKTKTFHGIVYYEGKGVGWKAQNKTFYLSGGTAAERWRFATHLAPQTLGEVL